MFFFRVLAKEVMLVAKHDTDMIEVIVLPFMSLQHSKNFITENIAKIAFSLPFRFSSLRKPKAHFIKLYKKKLYKKRLKTPVQTH